MSYFSQLREIGTSIIGRAVTETLYVSPNGSGGNGKTWASAYTTIQAALDAASVDADDATLIAISPHATNYDIATAGDPTWAANVILIGTHRTWAKVKNTNGAATSIMKLTGKASCINLNFNLGAGSGNGLIMTHGGFRVYRCQFVGEDLTGAATALHLDGATAKHGKVVGCDFKGHVTHMTGMLVDNITKSIFRDIRFHECHTAIQTVHADADENYFDGIDIGNCGTGLDLDAGNCQHFNDILFHDNTVNVADAVGDHHWSSIRGEFPISVHPDSILAGVTLTADNAANAWGADTEIRSAAAATKPFRVIGVYMDPGVAQWYRVRFTTTGAAPYYDDLMVNVAKREGIGAPSGTEYIFNKGTRISASTKAETGGLDTIVVWIEIQEI